MDGFSSSSHVDPSVVRAADLPSIVDSAEVPSSYVEVSVDKFRACTRVIEHSANPSWDETVEL